MKSLIKNFWDKMAEFFGFGLEFSPLKAEFIKRKTKFAFSKAEFLEKNYNFSPINAKIQATQRKASL